jgi:hypothetical protein
MPSSNAVSCLWAHARTHLALGTQAGQQSGVELPVGTLGSVAGLLSWPPKRLPGRPPRPTSHGPTHARPPTQTARSPAARLAYTHAGLPPATSRARARPPSLHNRKPCCTSPQSQRRTTRPDHRRLTPSLLHRRRPRDPSMRIFSEAVRGTACNPGRRYHWLPFAMGWLGDFLGRDGVFQRRDSRPGTLLEGGNCVRRWRGACEARGGTGMAVRLGAYLHLACSQASC